MSRWRLGRGLRRIAVFLAILGPGLITASAGNDAPGIVTYSVAGSTYGFSFLWILLWTTLAMVVVLEMAARMGAYTGKGLTDLARERFGVRTTVLLMLGFLVANLGTTTAQFAGVASAAELFGISRYLAVPVAGVGVWLLVTRGSYGRVEKVLLGLSAYAIAYVVSGLLVRPPWGTVARSAVIPTLQLDRPYLLAVLATVGTTVTPWMAAYMQASVADKGVTMADYGRTRLDATVGPVIGNIVSGFIIIATASTLHAQGIRVESAAQAALALEPVAGVWAELLFGVGLLGASLLAASVLPLATTYAICEAFGWERGVNRSPDEAPAFYGLYTGLIVLGGLIVLIPGVPLFPLMWLSQVVNAVLLPVVLVIMLLLASDARIMGPYTNRRHSNVFATVLTGLVTVALVALLLGS